jgi:hypothetical protein
LAGLALASVAIAGIAAFLLMPLAVQLAVRGLIWVTNACIWIASSLSAGADLWTIAGTLARSAREALTTTAGFVATVVLVIVGAAALWGLQRLLGPEGES